MTRERLRFSLESDLFDADGDASAADAELGSSRVVDIGGRWVLVETEALERAGESGGFSVALEGSMCRERRLRFPRVRTPGRSDNKASLAIDDVNTGEVCLDRG